LARVRAAGDGGCARRRASARLGPPQRPSRRVVSALRVPARRQRRPLAARELARPVALSLPSARPRAGAGSRACARAPRRHGLRAVYHGDEGVIEVASFSLEGRPIRKVRQSVNRLQRAGYSAECVFAGDVDATLAAELGAVAAAWRGSQPQRGFTMAFGSLFDVGGREALFVVGRDAAGAVAGFFHMAVSPASRTLSLS